MVFYEIFSGIYITKITLEVYQQSFDNIRACDSRQHVGWSPIAATPYRSPTV